LQITGRDKLDSFIEEHADQKASLQSWLAETEAANWSCPEDINAKYKGVKIVGGNKVTFSISQDAIWLVMTAIYRIGIVRIDKIELLAK
jgi:mRNA-degrading endonuclease HigB of HigAB toxin-antitoxin module